jgi:predicted metal-binding membrane protein
MIGTRTDSQPSNGLAGTILFAGGAIFILSAAATIYLCGSMSGGMPMPGGWQMSMAWMTMPSQSWLSAALSFIGMWMVMMVAMMLPSLLPVLMRSKCNSHLALAIGYFFVWLIFGLIAYPIGLLISNLLMQSPVIAKTVPLVTAIVLICCGLFQFTSLKASRLACCTKTDNGHHSSLKMGLQLGLDCAICCLGFMLILLVIGVMDLRAMAIVAIAITIERMFPRTAKVIGVLILFASALKFLV